MKALKRMALVAGAVLAFGTVEAQYTFSAQIVISGNCWSSASNMAERNLRQLVNEVNAKMKAIPLTKAECMAMSQQFAGEMSVYSFNEYGCSIKMVITPCICTGCQEESSSPDQGGSYHSANAGSEVKDWTDDMEARQMALNQQSTTPIPSQVEEMFGRGTGDQQFDKALQKGMGSFGQGGNNVKLPEGFEFLANMVNVRKYLDMTNDLATRYISYPDPDHLVAWFHEEFKRVSGFDLDAIMNKLESRRTDAEKQALLDYRVYRQLLADKMINQIEEMRQSVARSEETRAYEMAVLSDNCYGDSKHEYLANTNYREVGTLDFPVGDPMRAFSEVIDKCNKSLGFHAELYYNAVTGEYTVAFEGSNTHYIKNWADFKADWFDCNFKQELGGVPEQYILAKIIADHVPDGVSMNFTGHSLGGGLASVAGAISGAPTYTYNPESVNNNIVDAFGIRENVDVGNYNITAYQADDDPLTSLQEGVYKKLVVGFVLGSLVTEDIETGNNLAQEMRDGVNKGTILNPALGTKVIVETGGGHDRKAMVNFFGKTYDWNQPLYGSWQKSIYQAGHGTEQQTEEHILIVWPE